MKPVDLPLYDECVKKSPIYKDEDTSLIELNISRCRVYLQEHSIPLQNAWSKVSSTAADTKYKIVSKLPKVTDPHALLTNTAVIGGAAGASILINRLLFPKAGMIRRILTPLTVGTLAAVYCYPDDAITVYRSAADSAFQKYDQFLEKGHELIKKRSD